MSKKYYRYGIIKGQKVELQGLKNEYKQLHKELNALHLELQVIDEKHKQYDYIHLIAKIVMSLIVFIVFVVLEIFVIDTTTKLVLLAISLLVWVFSVNTIGYLLESILHVNHNHHKI